MEKRMRAGKVLCLAFCICMLGITACGGQRNGNTSGNSSLKANENSQTSISLNNDGSISSKIVEDFGESYYNVNELKEMFETVVSEYKSANPSAQISLKKCDVSKGVTNVQIEYGDYEAYAGFNSEYFFVGTIQAANQAGVNLDITLNAVATTENKTTVSKTELLGMENNHIVVVEAIKTEDMEEVETVRVNCFDEILYVSENVSAVDNKSADVRLEGGYGIIVFK